MTVPQYRLTPVAYAVRQMLQEMRAKALFAKDAPK